TPLEIRTLLFAKWLGSILSVRAAWFRLGTVWGVGILFGALHALAVLCLLITWFLYAALLSCLGLWFSVVNRSAQRAIVWTLLVILAACLPPILLIYGWLNLGDPPAEIVALMPMHEMGVLAFSQQEYNQSHFPFFLMELRGLAISLGLLLLATGGLFL